MVSHPLSMREALGSIPRQSMTCCLQEYILFAIDDSFDSMKPDAVRDNLDSASYTQTNIHFDAQHRKNIPQNTCAPDASLSQVLQEQVNPLTT